RDQKTILLLSGIIRIADGLDYLHRGTAREIHCDIGNEILCTVFGSSDLTGEKEHARARSALLNRVTGRILVIR
ncbi:MAG: hypothetical protein HGA40_06105, partial [Methanoregulaceae archaeon]|nr:hypothetical protein [Methanoregulaceae archaeon]